MDTWPSYESFSPTIVSLTLWVSIFWGLMLHTMRMYVTFLSWGTSCFCMKKHVSVPLISLIPWNSHMISISIALVHFCFSVPFIRCLYSWYFSVSGKMTAFICPVWIFTYPAFLLVCTPSYPVLCTVCVWVLMLEVVCEVEFLPRGWT